MFALKFFLKDTKNNVLLALGLWLCVVSPDFLINKILGSQRPFFNTLTASLIFMLCLSMSFLKKKIFIFFWIIFAFLESIQFTYIAYFGVPIPPYAISAIFTECKDIFQISYLKYVWFVYLIIGIVYGVGFLIITKFNKIRRIYPIYSVCMVIYILYVGSFNALTLNPLFFYSKIQEKPERLLEKCIAYRPSHSLHTSIFALSCAIIQKYVKVPSPNYKPYSYHHIDSQTKNIILIIGESLSSEHLKVFGYPRDTMPYIESMTKNSKFFLKKAFSSGVGTKVSLTLFFNVIREPNNQEALLSRQGNLFKQAKAHGFKTILLSNNTGSIVIDGPIDIDQRPLFLDNSQGISSGLFGELGDRAFPMLLSKISLGEKNFIVLHMNAPHSPYDQHYQALGEKFLLYKTDQFDKRNSFINSYDNCLRYVDEEVFKPLIKTFKEIFKNRGESHLIFISDHGELFGEKDPITHLDLFGHGHLNIKSAKVPFWMYSLNTKDESYVKKVLSQPSLASYEVAKMILMLMGTQVENPNEQEGMYYVSADLLSNHFIEYKKY